jgi:hypothetical protein
MTDMLEKPTLYVCGDSFSSQDLEYGKNWTDLLADNCPNINVINLSNPGASNYLIYLQVKEAIKQKANYIIFNASSSTRNEFLLDESSISNDSLDRYWNTNSKNKDATIVSCSWINPWDIKKHNVNVFSKDETKEITNFFKKRIDITSLIEKNYIFVIYTLQLIESNNITYAWSQGGFEHKSFESCNDWDFSKYRKNECKINLWDYGVPEIARPYFHITDNEILKKTCDEYINILNLTEKE